MYRFFDRGKAYCSTAGYVNLGVWLVAYPTVKFGINAVPFLDVVSKCNVGYSLMFVYIHILSS